MFKTRIGILAVLLGLAFLTVLGRLWQLQVARYDKYRKLATRDQATEQMVPALRGSLLDRHGNPLAEDRPFYDLSVRVDRLELFRVNVADIAALPLKYRAPQGNDDESAKARARLRQERDAQFELLVRPLPGEPFVKELARAVNR
ncbi:MAG: hypothetical protein NTW87_06270, partial [Planctomycetota bacterium]|nr:hypothetical protein [Planctomycetota bacterium]